MSNFSRRHRYKINAKPHFKNVIGYFSNYKNCINAAGNVLYLFKIASTKYVSLCSSYSLYFNKMTA